MINRGGGEITAPGDTDRETLKFFKLRPKLCVPVGKKELLKKRWIGTRNRVEGECWPNASSRFNHFPASPPPFLFPPGNLCPSKMRLSNSTAFFPRKEKEKERKYPELKKTRGSSGGINRGGSDGGDDYALETMNKPFARRRSNVTQRPFHGIGFSPGRNHTLVSLHSNVVFLRVEKTARLFFLEGGRIGRGRKGIVAWQAAEEEEGLIDARIHLLGRW